MAHKKAGGSSRNGRDSESKRLGVKAYGGEAIHAVGMGKDHTLYALVDGKVEFATKGKTKRKVASVVPPTA